ncbi:SRPBCC domain-containing protein [Dyella sp. ASV21]|uniref:SRPBCC domain-containing protein n=1 Tax=Dyella sp. ASV21 TaxID=2795114 RepID=UPI0018ED6157|nr:SRPBCC domain-containing protein [Dyella sp. ASV21]
MTTPTVRTLHLRRHFDASAERVFDAWLDPATAGRWLFSAPNGEMINVDIDARPGGRFRFVDRRDGEDVDHVGQYLEIDRPRRLVFTFGVPKYADATTRVSIDIVPAGTGCNLTLVHEEVLPEWADATARGWTDILGQLESNVLVQPPRQRLAPDTIRFERRLPGTAERVWSYLVDSDKRSQWLASGAMEPRAGSEFQMHFLHSSLSHTPVPPPERFKAYGDGATTRHRVLACEPPHKLVITWGDRSEVTFELTAIHGQTQLTVTHRKLVPEDIAITSSGWHTHLDTLMDRLDGHLPQPYWPVFSHLLTHYEQHSSD